MRSLGARLPATGASRGRSPDQMPVMSAALDRSGGDRIGGVEQVLDILGSAVGVVEGSVPRRVGGAEVDLLPPRDDEDGSTIVADRDDRGDVAGEDVCGDGDVDPLGRPDRVRIGAFVEGADLVRPHPCRIDHHRGPQGAGLGAEWRDLHAADPPVRAVLERDRRAVVEHRRTVVECRGAEHGQSEPCVVGPCVPVEEAIEQVVGLEGREVGERLGLRDALVAPPDADAPGQVVEPERGAVGAGDALVQHPFPPEDRDQKGKGPDQVRRVVEQPLSLGQVLVDQPVLALLQVADPAVDELRRLGGGARGEVVPLDEGGPQAPTRRVEGDPGTGDSPADDQHVEGLRGQPSEGPVTTERRADRVAGAVAVGHGPRLPQAARDCSCQSMLNNNDW